LPANTTTYSDNGLTANTTYYYRVRAFNTGGNSGYSNVANATTQAEVTAINTNLDKAILISPVPTTDWVNVDFTNVRFQKATIKIYSGSGAFVNEINVKNNLVKINFTSYAKGVYYLHIQTEEGYIVRKIVVQ
jgi:hypothetical protein